MQRFDGVDPAFLWNLNAEADRPDLAVILEADPDPPVSSAWRTAVGAKRPGFASDTSAGPPMPL